MNVLVIATTNQGKLREFRRLLEPLNLVIKSLIDYPEIPEIEESGITFAENALLKAKTIAKIVQQPVLADDSGLLVDALSGNPGIYSARYAGEERNDKKNLQKVLKELREVEYQKRTARFKCVLALVLPTGEEQLAEGVVEGHILPNEQGDGGFGYDSIFAPMGLGKSFAQCTSDEKNAISHRKRGLQAMIPKIEKCL